MVSGVCFKWPLVSFKTIYSHFYGQDALHAHKGYHSFLLLNRRSDKSRGIICSLLTSLFPSSPQEYHIMPLTMVWHQYPQVSIPTLLPEQADHSDTCSTGAVAPQILALAPTLKKLAFSEEYFSWHHPPLLPSLAWFAVHRRVLLIHTSPKRAFPLAPPSKDLCLRSPRFLSSSPKTALQNGPGSMA